MGHPELMSTKSTSVLLLMSSAHLVMVSGKHPSTWRHNFGLQNWGNNHNPLQKTSLVYKNNVNNHSATLRSLNNLYWHHLDTKNIFTFVSFQEGPLWLLPLQQVCAHGHLPTGDICSKALAHTTERQISTLRKRGNYLVMGQHLI